LRALRPGAQVKIQRTEGNWSLVAREGIEIGYFPTDTYCGSCARACPVLLSTAARTRSGKLHAARTSRATTDFEKPTHPIEAKAPVFDPF
jgi:hypothetical protein